MAGPVPGCVLAQHPPCGGSISREHYISKYVLKRISPNDNVRVTGTPWAVGEQKSVGKEALTAKILCEKHNSSLSILDTFAGRFFETIQTAQLDLASQSPRSKMHTFVGANLERWLLKVVFGMWISGNLAHRGAAIGGSPPPLWADILLDNADFPTHWGLYGEVPDGPFRTASDVFELVPLSNPAGGVIGVKFMIAKIPLTLSMDTPNYPWAWGIYRPSRLIFQNAKAAHVLNLTWAGGGGDDVTFTRVGDP